MFSPALLANESLGTFGVGTHVLTHLLVHFTLAVD